MSGTRAIHVGTPPRTFELDESIVVHFHDFASLSTENEVAVKSPKFDCVGHEWSLVLYPGGDSSSKPGMIGVYLRNESSSKIRVNYSIMFVRGNGETCQKGNSDQVFKPNNYSRGWVNFAKRGDIIDPYKNILHDGTLTFLVRIRPHKDYYCHTTDPKLAHGENIFKLFNDEESADVFFKVGSQEFHAHKLIIKAQAPELAVLVDQSSKDNGMPINDVEPEIFEIMLKNVYGRSILAEEWRSYSKQILNASGKYGFRANLKLEAEAWYMKNLKFTEDNVIDELLYADGKNCPLIKEAALDFIIEKGQGVFASPSYARLAESPELIKEVLMEFAKSTEGRKRKRDH